LSHFKAGALAQLSRIQALGLFFQKQGWNFERLKSGKRGLDPCMAVAHHETNPSLVDERAADGAWVRKHLFRQHFPNSCRVQPARFHPRRFGNLPNRRRLRDPRTRGLRVETLPSHQGASAPRLRLQQAVHDETRVPRPVELPTNPPSFQLPRLRSSVLRKSDCYAFKTSFAAFPGWPGGKWLSGPSPVFLLRCRC